MQNEESLQRHQATGNSLAVVEPVDADEKAHRGRLILSRLDSHLSRRRPAREIGRVDADGKHAKLDAAGSPACDAVAVGLHREQSAERCAKVAVISARMKADEIRSHHPL